MRFEKDNNGYYTFYPNVTFPLDKKTFGEDRILKVYREHPEYFKDAATFIDKIFKGVYVKSDYGDGTILYVDYVALNMQFRFHYVNDTTGVALKKKMVQTLCSIACRLYLPLPKRLSRQPVPEFRFDKGKGCRISAHLH